MLVKTVCESNFICNSRACALEMQANGENTRALLVKILWKLLQALVDVGGQILTAEQLIQAVQTHPVVHSQHVCLYLSTLLSV